MARPEVEPPRAARSCSLGAGNRARDATPRDSRPDEATEGIWALGVPPDYPAAQAYAACLIAQRCPEEAGAGDESLWRAAWALDCGTFFGRFHIDSATGLQVGHETVLV